MVVVSLLNGAPSSRRRLRVHGAIYIGATPPLPVRNSENGGGGEGGGLPLSVAVGRRTCELESV